MVQFAFHNEKYASIENGSKLFVETIMKVDCVKRRKSTKQIRSHSSTAAGWQYYHRLVFTWMHCCYMDASAICIENLVHLG